MLRRRVTGEAVAERRDFFFYIRQFAAEMTNALFIMFDAKQGEVQYIAVVVLPRTLAHTRTHTHTVSPGDFPGGSRSS